MEMDVFYMVVTMSSKRPLSLSLFNDSTYVRNSCENIVLWRGHFTATEDTKSVNLSINGGEGSSQISPDGRWFSRTSTIQLSPRAFG